MPCWLRVLRLFFTMTAAGWRHEPQQERTDSVRLFAGPSRGETALAAQSSGDCRAVDRGPGGGFPDRFRTLALLRGAERRGSRLCRRSAGLRTEAHKSEESRRVPSETLDRAKAQEALAPGAARGSVK